MSEACENLTVVDFSQGMAGPMVTMILADHGANVIKVEPPAGDWARPLPGFQMWNRGKSSVVIDLSTQKTIHVDPANAAHVIWRPDRRPAITSLIQAWASVIGASTVKRRLS